VQTKRTRAGGGTAMPVVLTAPESSERRSRGRSHGRRRPTATSALYARFAPPQPHVTVVGCWLDPEGFRITHVGRDRMSVAARAWKATVERALKVEIWDFLRPATSVQGLKVTL
jgi:hypothetical protein